MQNRRANTYAAAAAATLTNTRELPRRARALELGEHVLIDGCPGLRLVRSTARAWSWSYRYRSPIDGRMRQAKIGRWPAIDLGAATARWNVLQQVRADGLDPRMQARERRLGAAAAARTALNERRVASVTVAKLVTRYLADRIDAHRSEKSAYNVRRMLEATLVAKFGERPAGSIGRTDAAAFLTAERSRAPAQAVLLKRECGAAWRHALAVGLLPENVLNPWDAHKAKDLGLKLEARTRALSDAELATLLQKLDVIESPARDALHLTLLTGARSGEVCAIGRGDVKNGVWHLHETKTDSPRNVVLPRQALAILARHPDGFEIAQPELSGALRLAMPALKLKAFTPHDLRRSARTGWARLGEREEIAEAGLGHVPAGIVGTYSLHRFEREVGEMLQRWADHLDALAAPSVRPLRRRA